MYIYIYIYNYIYIYTYHNEGMCTSHQSAGDGPHPSQSGGGDHHAFPIEKSDGHPPHGEEDLHLLHFEKEGGSIVNK